MVALLSMTGGNARLENMEKRKLSDLHEKGEVANTLGFAGHGVSAAATQLRAESSHGHRETGSSDGARPSSCPHGPARPTGRRRDREGHTCAAA